MGQPPLILTGGWLIIFLLHRMEEIAEMNMILWDIMSIWMEL